MRSLALPSLLTLVATLLVAPAASAADAPAAPPPLDEAAATRARPFFVGVSAGVGYANWKHPQLLASAFPAAALNIHAGYSINPHWAVGLDFSTSEKYVTRNYPGELFSPPGYRPQADCTSCSAPESGGFLAQVTTVFGTVGPRVDFTPFGRDGLYVGVTAGMAFVTGLDGRYGAGGGARLGYRVRPTDSLTFSAEAGVQGSIYADASTFMPYGVLVLRPYW
jgi:opacity protein-like surface antigen